MLAIKLRWALLGFLLLLLSGCGEKKSEENVDRVVVAEAPILESVQTSATGRTQEQVAAEAQGTPPPHASQTGRSQEVAEVEAPAISPERVASVEARGDDVEKKSDADGRRFSRAEFLQNWTKNCVRRTPLRQPDVKLEPAKLESYCGCVTEGVFGGVEGRRVEEWVEEMSRRIRMLEEFSKDDGEDDYEPDYAAIAEMKRRNREWVERVVRSENTCMKKLGISVRRSYETWNVSPE
jgi:hypothetical protein